MGCLGRRFVMAAAAAAALYASAAAAEYANPDGVAVIVGNRHYEHRDVPEVSYAHRDAEAFRRYVLDVLGFDPENIIDLRDANQAALETAFGNERSLEGDLWSYLDPEGGSDVVVFYSGHGVPGLNDGRGYLLPANADPNTAEINGYPIDVSYANLGKLGEARSVRVFLDACFSGGSDRGMLVHSASPVFVDADLPSAPRTLTVLTAASGDQVASWDEAAGHGLFTHHLLDALYGAGDADGDGSVTALEAKAYLDRHMTRAARRALRRRQNASLHGDAAAVLAAAAGGAFPDRPVVAGAADGADERDGAGAVAALPAAPDLAASEAALGLDRASRALVQRGLASLAFDPGPVDGAFGPRTRSALGAWQSAKGYEATGRLTREQAETLIAIGREAENADRVAAHRGDRLPREDSERVAPALTPEELANKANRIVRWKMASAFPGETVLLGAQGRLIEERIAALSGGTMEFRFFEPGALVPPFEIFDAVSNGSVDVGWSAAGYWAGKIPAIQFFTGAPFGPRHEELLAWMFYGGGQELFEELYHAHNIHGQPCNLLSPEGSGWFREPVETIDDLKGLKMRFFGLGAKAMEKLGVSTQLLAGGDIYPALELGAIDATEFSMPAIDLDLGFHEIVKHYYFPGWHQPVSMGELIVNLENWNGLTDWQREIVNAVCKESMLRGIALGGAIQFGAMAKLRAAGVTFHRWPDDILRALEAAWIEVAEEEAAANEDFARVWASFSAFREAYKLWGEYGYLD